MSVVSETPSRVRARDARLRRRRVRRLGDRVTIGHVAPIVLAVFAAVFVLAALEDRSASVEVPVALSAIPVGAPVNAGDTRLVRVHRSDGTLLGGLISSAQLHGSWVAAVRIVAGDPITRSVVAQPAAGASGLGAMSLPVPTDRADGGALAPGDRVDILGPSSGSGATYLAEGLEVLAVSSSPGSGVLGAASTDYWVSVAVDRATALRLASALSAGSTTGTAGSLEVVRSTGEAPPPQTSSQAARGR